MRLNVGSQAVTSTRKHLLGKDTIEKHSYAVELMLNDDTMQPEGALVVDLETDRQWQLIAARLLRQ